MKYFGIVAILILLLPAIFQLIYGNKAIYNHTKPKFKLVCVISIMSQIVIAYLGSIAMDKQLQTPNMSGYCGMPIFAYVALNLLLLLIILIIMGIQLYIKVARKNKLN